MKKVIRFKEAVLKRIGNNKIKSRIWDQEYADGQWDYLTKSGSTESYCDDIELGFLEKYCAEGSILDLGCGMGDTGLRIGENKCRFYMGVDISEVAIENAVIMCQSDSVRKSRNNFVVGDIERYTPDRKYNVILFKESLYYVNRFRRRKVLNKYHRYLKKDGVMIVRISDRERFQNIANMIEKHFKVIEKYVAEGNESIILVFK